MKQTTLQLINILKSKEEEAIEYFNQIALGDQTDVKYGFDKESLSINFIITGSPKEKHLGYAEKLDQLLNTNSDLNSLYEYLPRIKNAIKFNFCPYLKINKEPEMYAARFSIYHIPKTS